MIFAISNEHSNQHRHDNTDGTALNTIPSIRLSYTISRELKHLSFIDKFNMLRSTVEITSDAPETSENRLLDQSREHGAALVWFLSAAQVVSWGTFYYTFALISDQMEHDLGWDKTTINGAWSIALLVTGLCGFPVGILLDRIGGRFVMTAGTIIGAVFLVLWSTINSIAMFYVTCIGLGIAMSASLYEAGFAVLTQRFPRTYQRQIARMSLIGGFTPAIFVPTTALLVEHFGWRSALLALGAVALTFCVPIHALLLRDNKKNPSNYRSDHKINAAISNAALKRAVKHPVFWLLLITFTIHGILASAIIFHIVPLLKEKGLSDSTITFAYMLIGPAQVAGRLGLLTLQNYFRMTTAGLVTFLALPIAFGILIALPPTNMAAFTALVMYGLGNGLYTIVRGTSVPDLLGRDGYGAINGVHTLAVRMGGAAAPVSIAITWDFFGTYDPIIWMLFGMALVAAVSYATAVYLTKSYQT